MKYIYLVLLTFGIITLCLINIVAAGVLIYAWANGALLATALWSAFKVYVISLILGILSSIVGYIGVNR